MGRKTRSVTTWCGIVVRCLLLGSCLFVAGHLVYNKTTADTIEKHPPVSVPGHLRTKIGLIRERLAAGQDVWMQRMFPEGQLFSHSFYGSTLVNVALANPGDAGFRQEALAELERLIPLVKALGERPPYDVSGKLVPKGGVIVAAHVNKLRAGYLLLGGKSTRITDDFHADCRILHEAFLKSATRNLESYPGRIWPVDNLMALEALRIHDDLYKTGYGDAVARWTEYMSVRRDETTGLLPSQIDGTGKVVDGPRGSALSWSLAILPTIAPELASEQYGRYRGWLGRSMGMAGFREYPPGVERPADADSGPIVGGLGMAASGLGIAAAKANGDTETFMELSKSYERSHLGGFVLLVDELALWGQTLTPWTGRAEIVAASDGRMWMVASWLLLAVVAGLGAWWIVRGWRQPVRVKTE